MIELCYRLWFLENIVVKLRQVNNKEINYILNRCLFFSYFDWE